MKLPMNARSRIIATAIGGLMLAAGAASARQNIRNLPGSDAVKAFDVMTSRGFTSVDAYTTSDDYLVTWWYNASTGQCVNTQSKNGRVTSAAEDRHPKCTEAAAQAGGGAGHAAGKGDSFETVCGVIVGGKDSAYRCRVRGTTMPPARRRARRCVPPTRRSN
jgi:hypothetical protein